MYWLGRGDAGQLNHVGLMQRLCSRTRSFRPEARAAEGCGLLADGQTCCAVNHSGIRRDCVNPTQGAPVAGSPHRGR